MERQDLIDVPYHNDRDYNNTGNSRSRLLNHAHNKEQSSFITKNSSGGHYPDDHYYDDDINEDDLYYDDDDVDQHYDNYNYAHIDHSPRKPHGKGKGKGKHDSNVQSHNHQYRQDDYIFANGVQFPKIIPKNYRIY